MNGDDFRNIQARLIERRKRLQNTISSNENTAGLANLLIKVDSALERMNNGTYGICEVCHEPIERDRLMADPLVTFCLGDLNKAQQKLLEDDLTLASTIQSSLLPANNVSELGYKISYNYLPAGPVSGDYCDLVISKNSNKEIFFFIGDITGKGIAASMLVTHIHAMFHSLIELNLSLKELMERANRLFCESSLYTHFATLVCGKAIKGGKVEICNAGHCLPVIIKKGSAFSINSNGLPLGLIHQSEYSVNTFSLEPGESIFLYSDGLSETRRGEEEFGTERINQIASMHYNSLPVEIINDFKKRLDDFSGGLPNLDDLTMMSIKRME